MTDTEVSAAGEVGEVTLHRYRDVQQAFRRRSLKQALYDEGGVIMRDVLLTLHGDAHRARRRLENRLFRRSTFQLYEHELIPDLIADTIAPAVATGGGDLLEIGHRTTLHLTALIAGVDRPRGTPDETDRLYHFVRTFSAGATLVHSTLDRDAVRAEVAAALDAFDDEFLTPSIDRRRSLLAQVGAGDLGEDDLPRDVLTVLLANTGDDGQPTGVPREAAAGPFAGGVDLPRDVIRREIAFYLQAGSHSSANAFTDAMDDLFTWFADHPDDREHCLTDRDFLQRCVHESLRLHPASPVAWRVALDDVTLRDGVEIPAGTRVVMDLMAANRDLEVFGPDAASFNPYRPDPDNAPRWGHTFGGGPHVCIGMELDGGTTPDRSGGDAGAAVFGLVPQMVEAMLTHGARPDPDNPPRRDDTSIRPHFAAYPVRFVTPAAAV